MGKAIIPNGHLKAARRAMPSPSGSGRPMSRQELADACNLELTRAQAAGGGQRWAGLTEKTIGALERGEVRWPNGEYRRALCAVLKRDERSLGLYIDRPCVPVDIRDRPGNGPAWSAAGHVSPPGSWPPDEQADTVDDVKRRSALVIPALAMLAAAVPLEPWNRLAYMLANPQQLDEPALEQLEGQTAELFRQEEHLPARQLAQHLDDQVRRLEQVAGRVPEPFAQRVLMTTGEALALAGWVAWDSKQHKSAQRLYARALHIAQVAGDWPLFACVLAYQSYGAEADGNLPYARRLLVDAQEHVRSEHSAATRAWLAAREAEVNAALDEPALAMRALDRAMTAYDYARPHRERPWTGFFTPSRLGSMTVTTYARLDHADLDTTTDAVVASLPSTDVKIKAVILADVAMAAVQRGQHDRGAMLGHQALEQTLAQEASLGRQRLCNLHLMLQSKREHAELADLDDRLLAHMI